MRQVVEEPKWFIGRDRVVRHHDARCQEKISQLLKASCIDGLEAALLEVSCLVVDPVGLAETKHLRLLAPFDKDRPARIVLFLKLSDLRVGDASDMLDFREQVSEV